jgi:hypothetical protein
MVIARKYVGMSVAALVMSLGTVPARAQSASNDTKPEVKVRKHIVHADKNSDAGDSQNQQSISIVNDGDAIALRIEDGKVVSATRNGKEVPLKSVIKDGGHVKIVGDDGTIDFEMDVDQPAGQTLGGQFGKAPVWNVISPGKQNAVTYSFGKGDGDTWSKFVQPSGEDAEPPKVMIGVQLAEPDRSLLGHFHLKAGEATLVSAVHQGLPAADAGIKPYDLIIAVDGSKKAAGQGLVRRALRDKKEGERVTLTIIHEGQKREVEVKLVPYDNDRLEHSKVDAIPMEMGLSGSVNGDKQLFLAPDMDLDKLKDHLRSMQLDNLPPEDRERIHKELENARTLMQKGMSDAHEQVKKSMADAEKAAAQQHLRLFRSDGAGHDDQAGGNQDRVRGIEDRLDRLEKMLERIIEKQDTQGRARRSGGQGTSGDKAPRADGGGD